MSAITSDKHKHGNNDHRKKHDEHSTSRLNAAEQSHDEPHESEESVSGRELSNQITELQYKVTQYETEMAKYEQQLTELKEKYLRSVSDSQNSIKHLEREKKEFLSFANQSLLEELTTPLDHLFLALATKPDVNSDKQHSATEAKALLDSFYQGIEMTKNEFLKVLEKSGLKRLSPLGEAFDPHFHQAISRQADESKDDGTIITVIQSGYVLNGRLLKPALVIVSHK